MSRKKRKKERKRTDLEILHKMEQDDKRSLKYHEEQAALTEEHESAEMKELYRVISPKQ